jgi:nucleoside-diphosphate-sugar epimerase
MASTGEVWIVGCGDVGRRLARLLIDRGKAVTGWVRSAASAAQLQAEGIAAQTLDLDAPETAGLRMPVAMPDWIFWFAPPPDHGSSDPRIRRFLAALPQPPRRLIYLSTSGVYGDCAGRWIDETAPLNPKSARAQRRVDAEAAVRDYAAATAIEALILRVPGIYGPGRLPAARLREGRPILRAEDAPYTNRIHADDLAAAALIVAERGAAGAAYNISDGQPTSMTDYLLRCAALLGLPPPPQVDLAEARRSFSPMLMSFLDESKRLRTGQLRALGWTPRYPDLAQGLPASVEAAVPGLQSGPDALR